MKGRTGGSTVATLNLPVEVPEEDWIAFLTEHSDIFGRGYSGYWCRGVEHIDAFGKKGWLCYEQGDDEQPTDECVDDVAFLFVMGNQPLPERWFFLDRDMAIKAYLEGVKRWGALWFDESDGHAYDIVLQLAALGEVRYG